MCKYTKNVQQSTCPKCGSVFISAYKDQNIWTPQCMDCGLTGPSRPEMDWAIATFCDGQFIKRDDENKVDQQLEMDLT